jgi:hypothetical protein
LVGIAAANTGKGIRKERMEIIEIHNIIYLLVVI